MKRILSVFVITCIIATSVIFVPVSASAVNAEDGILSLLAELEIMSGDPDGNMRLDDYVSRAEFTKIAVASSSYKNGVATNMAISPFPDVTYQHWSAPYVRVGVTNGLVNGYPDATFKPDGMVLYEEAIAIMLRVLGYTDADFGVAWPSGQIGLADSLDMTEGISCTAGEAMNRRQVARLVYNTLKTKLKGQQSALISVFDAQITEDITIIASSREDSAISSDEVFTTGGTYKIESGFDFSKIGMKGDAAIKDSGYLIGFVPKDTAGSTQEYIVYSVLDNKVMAYKDGRVSQIEIENDTPAYKGKSQTTFASLKSQLELGDRLKVSMSESGDIDYVTYGKGSVSGPVTAIGGNWKNTLNVPDNASYTRNGVSVSRGGIINYDVVYYLNDLNMVLAYNNKVTGVYEKATPNRDIPTSVTVSGKEYEIEGSAAFNKLYSGGNFEYGDTVTLLLGRNNKIADVISPSESADGVVGYLSKTGSKEYSSGELKTFTNYYINIVTPDGNSYEYITDKDYTENANSVVELSFSDGYARISRAKSPSNISGTFNWSDKKIGSSKLASSVEILDIGTRDVSKTAMYAKIYGQRIDGISLDSEDILYAKKNSSGEIEKLILDNVTNDAFSYGIVIKAEKKSDKDDNVRASYDYIADGKRYTTNKVMSISAGDAVMIAGNIQAPDYMLPINLVKGKITSLSADKLISGNITYKISDKVAVYKLEDAASREYSMIDISDIVGSIDKYTIKAYYDKDSADGGRVRVIVVSE